ncbi:MAG: M48 family metallopeptidase [candidate division NC10 bacterium]|nr:M48 family metallopeptidase [candidate division NC10 bacterium]
MRTVRTEWTGSYLDGKAPVRRPASIRVLRRGLEITLEEGTVLQWFYRDVRQAQGFYAGEEVRLERGGDLAEVLLVAEPGFLVSLHRIGKEAVGHLHDPRRRSRRATFTLLAAVGALGGSLAVYFWLIPFVADSLAVRVPVAWEERLGRSVTEELAPPGRHCRDPQLAQAVGKIVERLGGALPGTPYKFRVFVVNDRRVNALAAPGGYILVFRGLLERARTPEELAGVLAHEIQHVIRRDVTRALLRQASSGLLLRAVMGDAAGVMTYGLEAARALAALKYSREAEAAADAEGLRLLLAARIDPASMLAFFEQLLAAERRSSRLPPYLSTHPETLDRLIRLRAMVSEPRADMPTPLLPEADWQSLRLRCAPGAKPTRNE